MGSLTAANLPMDGNVQRVESAIERGVNVNASIEWGGFERLTALMAAAAGGNPGRDDGGDLLKRHAAEAHHGDHAHCLR